MSMWLCRFFVSKLGRHFSTAHPSVKTVIDSDGVAIVTMQHAPVNVFDYELANTLQKTLHSVINDNPRALILTSAYPKIFTAGLDLSMLTQPNIDEYKSWWFELQEIFLALNSCSAPTVAAITGYAAGYGTMLACSCEYRIMINSNSKGNLLGYHEVHFGFNPPPWFLHVLLNVLPRRSAELAVLQGTLFTPTEAFNVGLIDELALSKDDALERSKKWIEKSSRNVVGRGVIKQLIRREAINNLKKNRQKDIEVSYHLASSKEYQNDLSAYLQVMKINLSDAK